jgi:hypothetical protein
MYDLTTFKNFPQFKKRFLLNLPENYQQKEEENNCWLWQGFIPKQKGYGVIS